jgi:hypothetical protein
LRTSSAWPPCCGATCAIRTSRQGGTDYHEAADLTGQANHLGVTIEADIIKQKLPENNGGYNALKFGKTHKKVYSELTTDHPIDLTRYQVANCYMGRAGLINSGGASGANDLEEAVRTAVINKRAGGMGLISGRKAFQRPMAEGVGAAERDPGRVPGRGGLDRLVGFDAAAGKRNLPAVVHQAGRPQRERDVRSVVPGKDQEQRRGRARASGRGHRPPAVARPGSHAHVRRESGQLALQRVAHASHECVEGRRHRRSLSPTTFTRDERPLLPTA